MLFPFSCLFLSIVAKAASMLKLKSNNKAGVCGALTSLQLLAGIAKVMECFTKGGCIQKTAYNSTVQSLSG
jgi:hypothetical protein